MKPPLVIACHGTRIPAGVTASHDLAALLRERLPGVPVSVGFVELAAPSVDDAVADALRDASDVVVVPLMVGTGVHVRRDIPASIARAATGRPAAVHYSAHLGAHPALVEALRQRVDAARGDWSPDETVVVCVGRGSLVGQANADHAGLARLLWERGGYADVVPGWIQVTTPSLPSTAAATTTVTTTPTSRATRRATTVRTTTTATTAASTKTRPATTTDRRCPVPRLVARQP